MKTLGPAPRYRAWVLRCWEAADEEADRSPPWRFSLEDPHTRERRGFAGMDALVAFLRAELAPGCARSANDPP
jgi:hypothetical protein